MIPTSRLHDGVFLIPGMHMQDLDSLKVAIRRQLDSTPWWGLREERYQEYMAELDGLAGDEAVQRAQVMLRALTWMLDMMSGATVEGTNELQ